MARFDSNANSYEWGYSAQMGGHALFFEPTFAPETFDRPERTGRDGARSTPKKVTRRIKRVNQDQIFL